MNITRETVLYVARLARLSLSDDEVGRIPVCVEVASAAGIDGRPYRITRTTSKRSPRFEARRVANASPIASSGERPSGRQIRL